MKKEKKNRVLKAICILAVLVIAIGLIQFGRYEYVANDGKTLCADNWRVTWTNSLAEVIISGEEQQDMLYSLSFDGDVKISTTSDNAAYTYDT